MNRIPKNPALSSEALIYGVPYRVRTGVAAVKGRCPRPLDEGDVGGARRDRTADLYTASVALSQLSYSPRKARHSTEFIVSCQTGFQLMGTAILTGSFP